MGDAEIPTGFEIAGEVYEVPFLDSFDMDEAQILYDLSGTVLEDFRPPHPDLPDLQQTAVLQLQLIRTRTPAFRRALVHIAYRRKHPDYDVDAIDAVIGKMNAADVSLALLSARGDDEVDPSQSSPKPPDSRNRESGTSESSNGGSHSGSDSAPRVVTLAPTGTGESGTSSQDSPPATSASAS